ALKSSISAGNIHSAPIGSSSSIKTSLHANDSDTHITDNTKRPSSTVITGQFKNPSTRTFSDNRQHQAPKVNTTPLASAYSSSKQM
ncbi:unnamed protein product, partial [Didymodactylos carnosus]